MKIEYKKLQKINFIILGSTYFTYSFFHIVNFFKLLWWKLMRNFVLNYQTGITTKNVINF